MSTSTDGLTLGADFAEATAEQWRHLALAALRKSGNATESTGVEQVDELLATVTYDGLRMGALHTPDGPPLPAAGLPGQWPFVRGARAAGGVAGGWDVRAHLAGHDPQAVREDALNDLENGATSLWLAVGGDALPPAALGDALDGVHLDLAGVVLDPGPEFVAAGDAWFGLNGAGSGTAGGGLGADPLGWLARTGEPAGSLHDAAALAARCVAEAPGLRAITVDATVYHEAGASDAEELGCAAAAGVAYLRALTDAGLPVRAALSQLEFRYAATADQFATIAKLRAARRIWARVAEMCDAADAGGQRQHAVTSAAMLTARDPWVNLLRTTLATFAAGVGGADAVTVLPFDHRLGRPDALAKRLARNTQTLLIEEAHVARVIDPAGGSWYVERYTEDLAHAAWDWFTTVEQGGGLAAGLGSGLIADRLAATWAKRAADIAHRRNPITGVSEFPNLDEQLPRRAPAAMPASGGLPRRRHAEAFERLRDRSDAYLAAAGRRPTVFLATLGSPGARLSFATNLFAAGGIAVVTGEYTGDTPVACLCGPDREYAERAADTAAALRAAGATRVLLAGRGDFAGVDDYAYTGGDAVALLTATLADLGVPQ